MPISIGRRLQGLRDLCFKDLRFKVVRAALTADQARDLDLPSTPLKDSERRKDRWREAFGREQTEIDALATLQPDALRQIVEASLAPYFDAALEDRVTQARVEWMRRAGRVIDTLVDHGELAEIKAAVADIEVDVLNRAEALKQEAEAIKDEAEERIEAEDDRLQALIEDIELPEPPAPPEPVLPPESRHALLVSSEWSFVEATQALKAQKSYGEGDA
jgi:hypothetical protein